MKGHRHIMMLLILTATLLSVAAPAVSETALSEAVFYVH